MNIPPEAKPVHPSDRPVEFSPDTPIRYRQLKNMSVKFVSAIGYILWGGVRATSVAAHKDITAILAGTAYGTAYVIDKAIQIPGYLLESGAVLASIQALEPAAREMVTTELEYARTHSDLEGQTVQQTIAYGNYGARGIKVLVSGIPFAAGAAEVASSVLEGYSTVDSLARQASNQNMEVVGKINSYFISFAAKLTPGAFWIASLGAKVAGSLTTFVKNKSFELWTNPEAPQQRMLNVSDRFHSFLTNWWHRYETPSSIQVRDLESFEESGQLTLELFKNFDELYKLKTLAVVFDKASLTPEEREFFLRPEFRNLSKRGDLTRLAQTDPDLKEKLEKKIVEKFNNLSQDARRLAFHLSSEQFRELPQESQQLLFMIVSQRATTKAEKKIIQKLQQNPQLLTENQYINSLLALFDRHYKGNENLAILAKITAKTQSVIVCGEIDTELQKLKSQIPAKSTEELLEINGIIQWLEEQKTLVANSPPPELYAVEANVLTLPSGAPIDATKIDEKIGLWVGTGSTIGECVSPAARILPYFIPGLIFGALPGAATLVAPSIIGYILSPHGIELPKGSSLREYLPKKLMVMEGEKCYLRGSLGCGSFENWLSNHIARATTVTELALLLPFAPGFLISKLGECGIPVDAAEEMLRLFPSAAYSLFWTFVRSIPPALQTISTPFRWLHENIKVVEEYKAGMQTLKDIYGNQTIDAKELTSLYNTFQATLDRICACAPGGKEVFTCNPEIYDVISKPGFWQTMAKDYNLPPESSEFYKSVVDTLQHGKLALPVFTPEEAAHVQEQTAGFLVSASNIGAQAKEKVYSLFTYLYANTIAGTRVEAVGGLAKKTLLATGLPDTLTNEAGRIGAVLSHTAKETSENLSRATFALGKLLGYQQEIPPDVLNILTAISKHYGDKAEKDALKNTALLAIEAYRELVSNWYAKAVGKIAESPDTKDLLEKFMKYLVKPGETIGNVAMTVATIGDRSQKLLDVELKNAQSSSFASSALASSFGLLQKDLSQAAGAAGKLGQQSSLATVSAIGTVLGLASGSYRMLPILLRYAVLPMIKNASSYAVRGGQSICYNIAAKYYDALDSTGRTLEEKCKNLSQACQYAINYLRPSVNDTRIQNFHSLSLNEKNHLIEIAIASRNISGTDKEYILKHKDLPKQTDVEVHKEIARRVIKAYDRLGTDERLLISPTFFELLDSAKQIRIQDLVERTIGLEPYERLDPAAIIAKFNSLASEVKKGIDDFTLMDFGRHSVDEQESILFQIANSQAYRDLMKTKSPSVAWTMEQFHRLQKMPLKELEKLIPLYDQVTPEEKKIYTPASFRALTAKSISDTE
ncbi:MAG: hypothetical protein LLF94_05955, partial [Chlamydiales bacterium]|nr:hypothetical protein [Chlamydiales bacterium]